VTRTSLLFAAAMALTLLLGNPTSAQTGKKPSCRPVSERTQEMGCWIMTSEPLGRLPNVPVYWHLVTYANRAAAESAKRAHETVVESLGRVWLMSIASESWQASGGEPVARIGPLPVTEGLAYTAEYMEAVFPPGFDTPVHRHPGPEAWYTIAGEVCLETPNGKSVGHAAERNGVIVAGGLPMRLSVTGTEQRRSLVLILHDSAQPHTVLASDWVPTGLCRR
jgi:quercetin dioxygenase-like cupin family protein